MRSLRDLGQPDLRLAGLSIWVHNREFDEATDYWDANWLHVTSRCSYPDADVWASGSYLRTNELEELFAGCLRLQQQFDAAASLTCIEPNLSVNLLGDGRGHIKVTIRLTTDHLTQTHEFLDEIDQTHLVGIIADCKCLLQRYPIRGERHERPD